MESVSKYLKQLLIVTKRLMSIEVVVVDPHVLMIESIVDLAADCRSGDIAELVVIDAHLRVAVAGQVDNPIIGDAVEQAAADAAADRADVDLARVAGETSLESRTTRPA